MNIANSGVLRLLRWLPPVLLATVATAQTFTQNRLVGWVDVGSATHGELHTQDLEGSCQKALSVHKALAPASNFWAGGTAYDPRHESVWVSDGGTISEVRLSDGKVLCSTKAQLMDSTAVVSGLAIADTGRRLIQLETKAGYGAIRSYSIASCPPVPLRDGCTLSIPKDHYTGGIAYDEIEALVYFTITKPGFQVPQNWLVVADASSQCKAICTQQFGSCVHFFGTDVTGLAFDSCKKTLFATTGAGTVPIYLGNPRKCELKVGTCCAKQLAGSFRGLAIIPAREELTKGAPCLGSKCPQCTKIGQRLIGGSPSLGNRDFGVEIFNGPAGAITVLGVGLSTCSKGYPFSCGSLWLPNALMLLQPGKLAGTGCDGSLQVPFPIPNARYLCGQRICLQWLVVCDPSAAVQGEGLTPALQFMFTNS